MSKKVLLVDDDANLLRACARNLRARFELQTALGGREGLAAIESDGPFAVVVSDMRMPEMDGIRFLEAARKLAPDTVRMMLTGNADLETAVAAVNDGNVFRFITKPCSNDDLTRFLTAGVEQYRLVIAERQVLEETLHGAVKVCTEILSAMDPRSYGQAERVRDLARPIASLMGVPDPWQVEVAALLAKIGYATIPPVVTVRQRHGSKLTGVEQDMLTRVPEIGHRLLENIPRLEEVAVMVKYAAKGFDGEGVPNDDVSGNALPLGSRILKVVSDFVELESKGETRLRAFEALRQRSGCYDPEVLEVAAGVLCPAPDVSDDARATSKEIPFEALHIGDLITSNVETHEGVLLVQAGTLLTDTLLERLRNFANLNELKEPIHVERAPSRVAQPSHRT